MFRVVLNYFYDFEMAFSWSLRLKFNLQANFIFTLNIHSFNRLEERRPLTANPTAEHVFTDSLNTSFLTVSATGIILSSCPDSTQLSNPQPVLSIFCQGEVFMWSSRTGESVDLYCCLGAKRVEDTVLVDYLIPTLSPILSSVETNKMDGERIHTFMIATPLLLESFPLSMLLFW
jgi:hypothetical protein